jgi:hypothetical protein
MQYLTLLWRQIQARIGKYPANVELTVLPGFVKRRQAAWKTSKELAGMGFPHHKKNIKSTFSFSRPFLFN